MVVHVNESIPVLDFHTHFAGDPTKFDYTLAEKFESLAPKQPFNQRRIGHDPHVLVKYLDEAGIDFACILAEEGPPTNYSVDTSFILGYAKQAPNRLFPIGNINPRIESNVGRRVASLIEAGIKGFKFYYADHNQDPYDQKLTPLYEACNERNLPIMIHTGTTSHYPMANPKFGDPMCLNNLFAKYPAIPFLMCHGGKGGHHQDALNLLQKYPNTSIEISDIAPSILRTICTEDLSDRFIFGTDMPQFPDYKPLIANVLNLDLTMQAKRKILFDNGARLLQLSAPEKHDAENAQA